MKNNAEIIQRNTEALVITRSLGLFFYNFTEDAIQDLRSKSREFKHVWDTYLEGPAIKRHKKQGGMLTIDHTAIYECFYLKMSYHTQAAVIEKALELHAEEARKGIASALWLEQKAEEHYARIEQEKATKTVNQ